MIKIFSLIFILILILADIFMFTGSSDVRIFGILFVYWIFARFLKLSSKVTFLLAIFFLILAFLQFVLSPISLYNNPSPTPSFSEKSAIWVFLLLVFGVIQQWRE